MIPKPAIKISFILTCYITDTIKKNLMGKEMKMAYDDAGDILDISIGDPEKAISREVEEDFFLRVNPVSGEVVGFSILNFRKWFKDSKDIKTLPIKAELAVP
jgi:uncharacterized protein YuzE